METEAIKLWLQAINMLGTFGLGVWLYLEKRSDRTNERVTELTGRVEQLAQDVTALQASAENAPSHADLGKVYESINDLAATVNQLVGESRGQTDSLRMILTQIMKRGME